MIKIGLLGCGRIGQVHGQAIHQSKRAQLVGMADSVTEAAQSLARKLDSKALPAEAILTDKSIDAIIICTPTDTHAELIEQAARSGKAILCEKPFDLSSERIQQCLEKIKSFNQPLLIGFNRRFDPNFANLKQRIDKGDIGAIEMVTILSRDPAPPPISYIKRSGGIFRDMMIHDFDMARFLLEEEPVEVHAVGSALVDPAIGEAGDVDTASVLLKTASGKICQISNSRRASYGYDQRIEVHGSKGMLRVGNLHETTVEIATAKGFQADPALHFFLERYMLSYKNELEHFLDCIENSQSTSPNGMDGLHAQILADAATEACYCGQPIRLNKALQPNRNS